MKGATTVLAIWLTATCCLAAPQRRLRRATAEALSTTTSFTTATLTSVSLTTSTGTALFTTDSPDCTTSTPLYFSTTSTPCEPTTTATPIVQSTWGPETINIVDSTDCAVPVEDQIYSNRLGNFETQSLLTFALPADMTGCQMRIYVQNNGVNATTDNTRNGNALDVYSVPDSTVSYASTLDPADYLGSMTFQGDFSLDGNGVYTGSANLDDLSGKLGAVLRLVVPSTSDALGLSNTTNVIHQNNMNLVNDAAAQVGLNGLYISCDSTTTY
ncbi:hypothetical protein F5Y15DRAFT_415423 [Xylariaceae sp. FL0016]|nr:hypothetical protein F5Y15DRAFT_415423 [Xylariaceae sp. FL0016]